MLIISVCVCRSGGGWRGEGGRGETLTIPLTFNPRSRYTTKVNVLFIFTFVNIFGYNLNALGCFFENNICIYLNNYEKLQLKRKLENSVSFQFWGFFKGSGRPFPGTGVRTKPTEGAIYNAVK